MSAWLELHTVLSMRLDAREAYRLMHNYRDEELRKASTRLTGSAESYPGELAMLRGLVRTLRVVVRDGSSAEKTRTEVQRLLWQHAADDGQARAETPAPAGPTGRVAQLLDAIRTARGRWTTVTAFRFYRDHLRTLDHIPNTQLRAIARGDLRDLAAWGHLTRHEEPGRQYYLLKTRKDGDR